MSTELQCSSGPTLASVLGAVRAELEVFASFAQQCLSVSLADTAQRSIKIENLFGTLIAPPTAGGDIAAKPTQPAWHDGGQTRASCTQRRMG